MPAMEDMLQKKKKKDISYSKLCLLKERPLSIFQYNSNQVGNFSLRKN